MARTSTARQQMVEGAVVLLSQRGLQGTSFSDVLAVTGAPRGSIYHHFPGGKHQLVAEAVESIGQRTAQRVRRLDVATPVEVVDAFVDGWRRLLVGTEFRAGCAIAAVTVGAGADAEDLLPAAAGAFGSWRLALSETLVGRGVPSVDADRFSVVVVAAVEGALVLARASRDIDPFEVVAAHLHEAAGRLSVRRGRSRGRTG